MAEKPVVTADAKALTRDARKLMSVLGDEIKDLDWQVAALTMAKAVADRTRNLINTRSGNLRKSVRTAANKKGAVMRVGGTSKVQYHFYNNAINPAASRALSDRFDFVVDEYTSRMGDAIADINKRAEAAARRAAARATRA